MLQNITIEPWLAKEELYVFGIKEVFNEVSLAQESCNKWYGQVDNWFFYRKKDHWLVQCYGNGLIVEQAETLWNKKIGNQDLNDDLFPMGRCKPPKETAIPPVECLYNVNYTGVKYITHYEAYSLVALKELLDMIRPTVVSRKYRFEQLKPEIRERVVSKWFDGDCIDLEMDYLTETLYEFNEPEIRYSGFYSQGDGASFTCKPTKPTEELLKKFGIEFRFNCVKDYFLSEASFMVVANSSGYYHENTVHVECELPDTNHEMLDLYLNEKLHELEESLGDYVRRNSRRIYKSLKIDYEYQMSEENIKEIIELNDYWFYENGELV